MSILKIIKNKSLGPKPKHNKPKPEPAFDEVPRYRLAREYYPYFWGKVVVCALGLISLGGGAYWIFANQTKTPVKAPVYFEIKAVDQGGHPVAGAEVYNQKKQLGVTDSFGEWRKLYAVPLGSSVSLRLRKQTAAVQLGAHKTFAIPLQLPAKGEMVLAASVKLLPAAKQGPRQAVAATGENSPAAAPLGKAHRAARPLGEGHADRGGSPDALATAQIAASDAAAYRSVWFRVIEGSFREAAAEKHQGLLKRYVVPALQSHSKRRGLQLNTASRWQVGLMHVPYPGGDAGFPGVIRVIASRAHGDEKIDFLANYTGRAASTAEKILEGLAAHRGQRFMAARQGDAWYLSTNRATSKLALLRAGEHVLSPQGEPLRLVASGSMAESFRLERASESSSHHAAEICRGALHCLVHMPYLPKYPPGPGWVAARMKVYGVSPGKVDVYMAGYQAKHEGDHIWRYWNRPGRSLYLSVLKDGSMIFRKKISGSPPSSAITSIPSPALSRK